MRLPSFLIWRAGGLGLVAAGVLAGCKSRPEPSSVVLLEVPAEAIIGDTWEDPAPVDFVAELQPLLETKCLRCHQRGSGLTNLAFHTKADLLRGAGPRPVLVPGQPESSTLFLVTVLPDYFLEAMPPRGEDHERLTPEERAVIYHWILQGAEWPEGVVLSDPGRRPKVTAVPPPPARPQFSVARQTG
jgi:hypothetical protein